MASTKLNARLTRRIVKEIEQGNFRKHAAEVAGVDERTVKEWMRKGQRPDARDPYKSFAAAVIRAEAKAISDGVKEIAAARKKGDTRATQWFLSRKAPNEWGDKARQALKEAIDTVLEVVEDELGPDVAARIFEAATRRLASSETETAQEDAGAKLH